jgi:DNA-binding transcriptional LysR family regulator
MDLNRTATFVRVVEAGNFTRAAEALRLPPSSVSRSVAKLEDDLGIVLLERTTRRVTLTDAGRAFFERAREALAGLEEANTLALDAAREAHGTVRVALPSEIGASLVAPLADFLVQHPRIRVEMVFTNHGAELVGDLVDLAITVGKLPDSALVSRRLGTAIARLCASPAYVARAGRPRTPAALADHDAIIGRAVAGEARWELIHARGRDEVTVHGRLVGDGVFFTRDAVLAGVGIALLPAWVADPLIQRGELVAVLPAYWSEVPLSVLTHGSRYLARRVVVLRDFLVDIMAHRCTEDGKAAMISAPSPARPRSR